MFRWQLGTAMRPHPLLQYGVAVGSVILALLASLLLRPLIEPNPFLLFFGAVAVASWYGGLRPGILATVLAALLSNYFLIRPYSGPAASLPDIVRLTAFGLIAILISGLSEARRQAELRLAVTLESIGDAVIATDTRGRVTFLNGVAEALTGWPPAEARGRDLAEVFRIVNEQTRAAAENPVARVLREGQVAGLANHTLLVARDGTERPIDDSAAPIANANGTLLGVVLVFRDVSQHHQVEEALRLSEERLRVALRNSPITVYAQDTELRYTWLYNPAPGYVADETIGKLDTDIAAPEDAARLIGLKRQVIATGTGIREEIRVRGATGELYFDLTVEPLRDAQGALVGVTGAAHDITARKLVELERNQLLVREQAARVAAQEAVRIRDAFFSVAAHELKTPLTSLMGHIQLIKRRLARERFLAERDQRAFDVVDSQSRRLNSMVEALLDVSRFETGQLSLARTRFDLCALVRQVVAEIQPTLGAHTLTANLPGHPIMVHADELRLEQVLQNLVQNAVKYSPDGGPVTISLAQQPASVSISVADQGIGIPQAALPQLFQRFYRASNVGERSISGMGIGLYVVKEIVALHGGSITAASEEGHGATFTIDLPYAPS